MIRRPLTLILAAVAAAVGCSNDPSDPAAQGGGAGQGGTGGAVGSAGTAGKAAGAGGAVGNAGGGQAGAGAKGGSPQGGTAGQGGIAGKGGGSGTAGSGGQAGAGPLTATPPRVGTNGEITATFDGAPIDPSSWIGLFAAGAPDGAPLLQQPTMGAAKGALTFETPADVGPYELRLFAGAGGAKKAATSAFSVELPYDLDPSFSGGKITFDFLGNQKADWVCGLRGIAGGQVLVGGTAKSGDKHPNGYEKNYFAVARLSASGALDPTFGNGGKAQLTSTTHALAGCSAFAVQPDGKIVVGGWGYNIPATGDFVLGRFNADGTPDASFGTDGIVTTDFGQWEELRSVAVLPDGKIVAGGTLSYSVPGVFTSAAFARYTSTGAPDSSFGTAGKMILVKKSWQETARALVVAPDGSFHAGISDDKSTQTGTVSLLHTTPSGALDPAFGTGGLVVESAPLGAIDRSLIGLSQVPVSNALVFLGQIQGGTWYLGRYSPTSGALDTAFGTNGVVTATFGSAGARPAGLMVMPSGQLLVGISPNAWDGGNGIDGNFGLARHQPNGALDLTFGRLRYRWNTGTPVIGSRVTAVDLQTDGKVLLGGLIDRGDGAFNFDFAVMRLAKTPGW